MTHNRTSQVRETARSARRAARYSHGDGYHVSVVVLARLVVGDFSTWLSEYERMHERRATFGERGHHAYRDADDPSIVTVIFNWETLEGAREYFEGAELTASLTRAEVTTRPEVVYLDPVDEAGPRI